MTIRTLLPPGWPRPKGYANGMAAGIALADGLGSLTRPGCLVVTGGVIGWDEHERLVAPDLAGQFAQALRNVLAILAEAGGGPQHIVRLTCYMTDLAEYRASLPAVGAAWREVMGRHFPAMAVVGVTGLVEPGAKVEIEATAVVD